MPVPAQYHSEVRAQRRKLKLALPYREPHSWGELNVAGRFIARLGCDENCTRQTQAQTARLTSQTKVCATCSPLLQRSTHCESQVPKRVNQTIGFPQRGNICLRLSASPASPPYPRISLTSVRESALRVRLLPVPLSHPHRGHYPASQAKACATPVAVARVSTRGRDPASRVRSGPCKPKLAPPSGQTWPGTGFPFLAQSPPLHFRISSSSSNEAASKDRTFQVPAGGPHHVPSSQHRELKFALRRGELSVAARFIAWRSLSLQISPHPPLT